MSSLRGAVNANGLEFNLAAGELSVTVNSVETRDINVFISYTTTQPAYQEQIGFYYSPNLSPLCNQIQTVTKFYQSFYSKMAESGISVVEISTEDELVYSLEAGVIKSLVFLLQSFKSSFSQNNSTLADWINDGGSLFWLGD